MRLLRTMRFELVPMANVESAIPQLPRGASVSVTCSPAEGVAATIALTDRLARLGHDVVPHVSARMVEGPGHVTEVANWIRTVGLHRIFVIAGDSPRPVGPYPDAVSLARALVADECGLRHIGFAAYPDGQLGISGLHCFTFNNLAETRAWSDSIIGDQPT